MSGAPRYERDAGDSFGVWQDLCETVEVEQRLLERRFAAFAEALR
jgi:hypothetical protein